MFSNHVFLLVYVGNDKKSILCNKCYGNFMGNGNNCCLNINIGPNVYLSVKYDQVYIGKYWLKLKGLSIKYHSS